MVWARASSRDSSPGNVLMLSVRPSITTSCTYRPRTRDAWGMAWLSAFSRDKISNKISSAGLTSWPTKKFAMDDTTFSEMYYGRHAPASSMQQASTPHASAERTRGAAATCHAGQPGPRVSQNSNRHGRIPDSTNTDTPDTDTAPEDCSNAQTLKPTGPARARASAEQEGGTMRQAAGAGPCRRWSP